MSVCARGHRSRGQRSQQRLNDVGRKRQLLGFSRCPSLGTSLTGVWPSADLFTEAMQEMVARRRRIGVIIGQ